MDIYKLPRLNMSISTNDLTLIQDNSDNNISSTLKKYIHNAKKTIEDYSANWDSMKKYTNIYEFIHSNIPNNNKCVCIYKPISRSFFKMIEIFFSFKLSSIFDNNNFQSFHLAEGPGGFIEAVKYLRKNNNDKYYGMTLLDDDDNNIPGWKKSDSLFKEPNNVYIEKGVNNKGDLLDYNNLIHCYNNYNGTMDLITADGGFDFSENFNKQENMCLKLIFAEIAYAISMQKKGGVFILKIFDIFSRGTIDLLFLLNNLYGNVNICKPCTSRMANSEKYIVCTDFKNFGRFL